MKLTLKTLIRATILSCILTAVKLYLDDRFGNWISPQDIKFWPNDLAILIAWGLYFVEGRKN